jgi:enoyl-CoA hydratase/carnithine racemase
MAPNPEQINEDVVLCEVDNSIATLTLNRPGSANGWTGAMEAKYFDLLAECEENPAVKAIVVTGAGRTFCPGADMGNLQSFGSSEAQSSGGDVVGRATRPSHFPTMISKPTIGAINGACAGVGLVQALMLDLRFSAPNVKYTFAFARRGLIAEYGSAWLLPRLVGQSRALDLMMSSRVVLAEEALSMGLINQVHAADRLLDETRAYAYDLATNCSPTSMAIMKQQVQRSWGQDLETQLEESFVLMNKSLRRPDFKEGVTSYIEKRAPQFGPLSSQL